MRTAIVLGAVALGACGSPYYTSDAIEAWVVDAATGKPIEGAIVTASWQLLGFTLDTGGSRNNQLAVMETSTDKNGRFQFPGFTRINFRLEKLGDEDPRILIFKPGYLVTSGQSSYPADGPPSGTHRKSRLNGMRFKLELADAKADTYIRSFESLSSLLMDLRVGNELGQVPLLLNAAICEKRRLHNVYGHKFALSLPGETLVEGKCSVD